jgi:hypothetical protein
VSTKRLGRLQPRKVRPILIVTSKADELQHLIAAAKQLRKSLNPDVRTSVYFNRNTTKAEAEAAYRARVQRRQATLHRTNNQQNQRARYDVSNSSDEQSNIGISWSFINILQAIRMLLRPLRQQPIHRCAPATITYSSQPSSQLKKQIYPICKGGVAKTVNLVPRNIRWQLPRLCLANVRSLRFKVDHLTAVFQVYQINISCVTESWLDSNIPTEVVDIDGYICRRRDRSDGRKGGGVICYVDANWPCIRLQSLETADLETIWLLIKRQLCHDRYRTLQLK